MNEYIEILQLEPLKNEEEKTMQEYYSICLHILVNKFASILTSLTLSVNGNEMA